MDTKVIRTRATVAPRKTGMRSNRMAMMAAMINVLSPSSLTNIIEKVSATVSSKLTASGAATAEVKVPAKMSENVCGLHLDCYPKVQIQNPYSSN